MEPDARACDRVRQRAGGLRLETLEWPVLSQIRVLVLQKPRFKNIYPRTVLSTPGYLRVPPLIQKRVLIDVLQNLSDGVYVSRGHDLQRALLTAQVQSRVTLSPQEEHLRAVCG